MSDRKIFRRKRRFQGDTWTPASISAVYEDGEWCPYHRKRHGYSKLKLVYGERNLDGKFKLLWCCPDTNDVLKEM